MCVGAHSASESHKTIFSFKFYTIYFDHIISPSPTPPILFPPHYPQNLILSFSLSSLILKTTQIQKENQNKHKKCNNTKSQNKNK